MSRLRRALPAAMALAAATATPALAGKPILLDRVTKDWGTVGTGKDIDSNFVFDISQPNGDPAAGPYDITIRCTENCRHMPRRTLHETTADTPLCAFLLGDGSDKYLSLWFADGRYKVRVYQANKHGIRKVAEVASTTTPQFLLDDNGDPVIVASDPAQRGAVQTLSVRGIPYSLTGGTYRLGLPNGSGRDWSADPPR